MSSENSENTLRFRPAEFGMKRMKPEISTTKPLLQKKLLNEASKRIAGSSSREMQLLQSCYKRHPPTISTNQISYAWSQTQKLFVD